MAESASQPAPGSGIAPPCPPFWREAGAFKHAHRAAAAGLWEGIAGDAAVTPLQDGRGLPVPRYARELVRLVRSRDVADLGIRALRYARIMARIGAKADATAPVVEGSDSPYHRHPCDREGREILAAWAAELRAGRCTILATSAGHLKPEAAEEAGKRLRRSRQGDLFIVTQTAADILRQMAEAEIRRHLPTVAAVGSS